MGNTYEYEVYSNVAGAPDLMSKLRSFALTQGWTVNEWRNDVEWDDPTPGTYEWVSGDGDFLDIESDGYGNQVLRHRFWDRTDSAVTGDSSHHWFYVEANEDASYSSSVSTNPRAQNRWGVNTSNYGKMSIPSGSVYKVHYIGDDKCIVVVIELSPIASVSFAIGTWELAEAYQNTTDCMMKLVGWNWAYITNFSTFVNSTTSGRNRQPSWMTCNYNSGLTTHTPYYFDGRALTYTQSRHSMECRNAQDAHEEITDWTGVGFRQRRMMARNTFTTKRPMIQPSLFMQQASDDRTVCVGMLPGYWTVFDGLSVGQFIDHGSDTYVVFPYIDAHRYLGWAMKVNV